MPELTPQLDAIIDKLSNKAVLVLKGEENFDHDEIKPLIGALRRNGFERHSDRPLVDYLRDRIWDKAREPAIHRNAEVTTLCQQFQEMYNDEGFKTSISTSHKQLSDPEEDGTRDVFKETQSPPDVHRR